MFKKGYIPWNKNLKGYVNKGSFQKCYIPHNKVGLVKYCIVCNKKFDIKPSRFDIAKFCSHQCYSKSIKGKSKGKFSKEHVKKIVESRYKNGTYFFYMFF